MPIARPFRAIRPAPDKVGLVVSRSYISYEEEDLRQKLASNPYSFIHIINPDFSSEERASAGSTELFHKVREKYLEFYRKDYFIQDEQPGYYIYRQASASDSFTGLIAATSSKDYADDKIKKHEQTLTKREEMFKNYLDVTGINAEPVLLSYRDDQDLERLITLAQKETPIYDFSTTDELRHTVWFVHEKDAVEALRKAFENIPAFYIADGHHRSASSAKLTEERNGGTYGDSQPHDFFMSYLLPASQMKIHAFHRLINTGEKLDKESILKALQKNFELKDPQADPRPKSKGHFSVYMDYTWYALELKKELKGKLDTELCSEQILSPIFGIEDLKSDRRISFISGEKGIGSIMREVDSGKAQFGIALYPVAIEEVFDVADRGATMPPKSTWVEPKLRSALTIYSLNKH